MKHIIKTTEWYRDSQEFRTERLPKASSSVTSEPTPLVAILPAVRLTPDALCSIVCVWMLTTNIVKRSVAVHVLSCSIVWLLSADRRIVTEQPTEHRSTPAWYQTAKFASSSYTFIQRWLSWIQLLRRLMLLLTTRSLRRAKKAVVCWNRITVRPNSSDIHKNSYRSFLYKTLSIGLCFREKPGSGNNILLYGTYKSQSVLSVFLDPSRWNSV